MTIKSARHNVTPDEHKLVVKFAKQCLREIYEALRVQIESHTRRFNL